MTELVKQFTRPGKPFRPFVLGRPMIADLPARLRQKGLDPTMRKTKIICTLGPATDKSEEIIRELMLSGMDVARFNFSHQTHEEHKQRFDTVVRLREELNLPIATLLDTKGPEVRLKTFQNGKIQLHAGDKFTLTAREVEGDETIVSVSFKDLPKDVEKGNKILIDDGLIELRVDEVDGEDIHCTVINGGPVSNHQGG